MSKVWFITGAGSGIGAGVARAALRAHDRVVATGRNLDKVRKAPAAQARGWSVHWYDRERVFRDAAAELGREDSAALLSAMGRSIGPPWQAMHKLAAAAALAATGRPASRPTAG